MTPKGIRLTFIFILSSNILLYSQDNTYIVSTNRPNQTDAIGVMAPGLIQLESGIGFQRNSNNFFESNTIQIPSLQLRFGLIEKLELNIFYDYNNNHVTSSSQDFNINSSYITLGSKYHLWQENGLIPEATGVFNIHYSHVENLDDDLDAEVRLIFQNTISNRISLKYMIRYRNNLAFAINPSFTINDNWSAFFEYYSDIRFNVPGGNQNGVNLGLGYLINNKVTLDFMYGTFFEESLDNYYLTTGVGWWIK